MTHINYWNAMPHAVDIICPDCGQCATFECVERNRIKLRKDIDFFKNSPQFEYRRFQDTCGHDCHTALYYPGLHGDPQRALHHLPDGYQPADWRHPRHLYRSHGLNLGSLHCPHCHSRKKHALKWPQEAYFSLCYKNKLLWAYHRNSAWELYDYLSATSRDLSKYRWSFFLKHIPTLFKTAKARENITRQLFRLLNGKTQTPRKTATTLAAARRQK